MSGDVLVAYCSSKAFAKAIAAGLVSTETKAALAGLLWAHLARQTLSSICVSLHRAASDNELRLWSAPVCPLEGAEARPVMGNKAVWEKLKALALTHRQLDAQRQTMAQHEGHVRTVEANQERLRQNIRSLGNLPAASAHLIERYIKDLNREEDTLAKARAAIEAAAGQRERLQRLVEEMQAGLRADLDAALALL